ncbi:hypothetical protein ISCGN_025896 [Ixodes scapularis]
MVIAFVVSMFIDPTMATGILAGFINALVLEVYANNLRIRYASYLLSVVKPTGAVPAEVDFVIKDSLNDRRRHSYAESRRAGLHDGWSMDSQEELKEKTVVVDREDDILRAIASMLVGLIATKSPVSRRASLWLLRLTGVRVWRVLLSVMVIAFVVSMFIDPTMATGILAGFINALVLEVYANNLRIRYASYLLSVVKPTGAVPAEVDFVIKDSLNDRRRHSYAESRRAGLHDGWSMDSQEELKEKTVVVDREVSAQLGNP